MRGAEGEGRQLLQVLLDCCCRDDEGGDGGGGPCNQDDITDGAERGGGNPSPPSSSSTSMVVDYLQHVMIHVAFLYPASHVDRCLQFVADISGGHPVTVRRCSMQHQVWEGGGGQLPLDI